MQLRRCDDSYDEVEEWTSKGEGGDETEVFERMMNHVKELMAITPA